MGLGLFLGGAATGAMSGYKLTQQYKDAQKQQGLERAYGQGSEVTQQYSPEQAAQMEAAASAINPETGQPYYIVSASPEGQYTFTTQGQEPLAGTMAPQYRLGAETGGTYTPAVPTEAQRHRGGLVSQQQYLASAGDPEEAAKIGERLQTSDVRDLQRKELERAESQAVRKEADNTKLRGMYEERQGLTEGTPEYAAATAKIQSFRESIDYDASQAAKLTELGISEKKYSAEKAKMEDNIWEGTASPEAFGKMLTEKYHDGNTYVAHIDKKTGVVHIIKDNSSDGEPPVTVATAPSWAALQDTTRQGSKKYAAAMVEQNVKFENDKKLKQMDIAGRKEVAGLRASGKVATYIAEDGRAVEKDPESDTGWSYADGSKFSGVPRIVSAKDTTQAKPPTVAEYNAWAVNNEKTKGETDNQHMARFQAVVKALSGAPAGERMVIAPDGTRIPESQVASWKPKPTVEPATAAKPQAAPVETAVKQPERWARRGDVKTSTVSVPDGKGGYKSVPQQVEEVINIATGEIKVRPVSTLGLSTSFGRR